MLRKWAELWFFCFMIHNLLKRLGFDWSDYGVDRIYDKEDCKVILSFKSQIPNSNETPNHISVKWINKKS